MMLTSDDIFCRIWWRREYGHEIETWVERTKRGKDQVLRHLMRKHPHCFTLEALRHYGLTRRGKPRRRA